MAPSLQSATSVNHTFRALLQYQQHAVALPYPERTEQVRYPVRLLLHVAEREMLLFPGVVQPDERGLRRLEARVLVDDTYPKLKFSGAIIL